MAIKKPTYKKYPKKPKKNASNAVKQRYLQRYADVKKENARRKREYDNAMKKQKTLDRKIYG